MNRFIYTIAIILVVSGLSFADDNAGVRAVVKDKVSVVISLLKHNDIDIKTRNKKILEALDPVFDFERMAKLSLGRKYWRTLSAEQQLEFSDLFIKRLKESYLEKLDLYTDEEVIVEDAVQVKSRIHVKTFLVSQDDKKDMIYKFYKTGKGWKVYDVEILGVSIIQTYRSQFDGFLKTGDMGELFERLEVSEEFYLPTGERQGN